MDGEEKYKFVVNDGFELKHDNYFLPILLFGCNMDQLIQSIIANKDGQYDDLYK